MKTTQTIEITLATQLRLARLARYVESRKVAELARAPEEAKELTRRLHDDVLNVISDAKDGCAKSLRIVADYEAAVNGFDRAGLESA